MATSVVIRTFPASDAALQRAARRGVEEVVASSEEELADALRAALVRQGYPAVEVRFRERLADVTGGSQPLLYVYRDGRAGRRTNSRRDRWYATLGNARETLDSVTRTWTESQELIAARSRHPRRGPTPDRTAMANAGNGGGPTQAEPSHGDSVVAEHTGGVPSPSPTAPPSHAAEGSHRG